MPKKVCISIKEDLPYLQNRLKQEKNLRLKIRIQSLILTKEQKFERRVDLAAHLGVGPASLNRWTRVYQVSGLESMLKISTGGARRNSIPKEVHEGLKNKVYDSNDPFLGYWEVEQWVKENYNLEIKYTTLRSYLIRHFKTKLKAPRKSHYKKSEQAITAFKKNA